MKVCLDMEETEQLENSATYLRDKLLIRLLARLGCRISEALALEVKDIDFTAGTVTIQRLKARTKLFCPKCGAGLGKSHIFCPKCGVKVDTAVAREQEYQGYWSYLLDFRNGFWEHPMDNFRSNYACLTITRFKD